MKEGGKRDRGMEDATPEQMVLTCKCDQKRVRAQAHKPINKQTNRSSTRKYDKKIS